MGGGVEVWGLRMGITRYTSSKGEEMSKVWGYLL